MAEDTPAPPVEVLFQVRLDPDLYARIMRQRDRWGMTNKEIATRIFLLSLPQFEDANGPPDPAK